MKWLKRIQVALQCGIVVLEWFDTASDDGVITVEEMTEGVQLLIETAGMADVIEIKLE